MGKALSRERIVAVARGAVEVGGVEALSLRAVASELGVTAPALYSYVTDKYDLIAAVVAQYVDELVARFDAVEETTPLDRIRALSHAYVDHALVSPQLFRLMFRYPLTDGGGSPTVRGLLPATRAFQTAAAATVDAIGAGELRDDDPMTLSLAMWAAVHGVAEVLLLGVDFGEQAAEQLADSVIEAMLIGQRP